MAREIMNGDLTRQIAQVRYGIFLGRQGRQKLKSIKNR